jgi:hypothetical protein
VPQLEVETPTAMETALKEENREKLSPDAKDYCTRIDQYVLDFFGYLNEKSYVHHLEEGMDTYDRFMRLIKTLSARPPIPAGEGIDTMIMTQNIFFLSRMLDRNDLRLLREVMRNEADTWEMNLDLFYDWFIYGGRCPDPEGIRPSLDVLYQYAGFFLNTIGGRAYLYRRRVGFRLLISYYCLLILHEADKRGKNSYGIDIFPQIAPLAREISFYPDFHFQKEYISRLDGVSKYYLQKR